MVLDFGGYERVCVAETTTVACVVPCEVRVNSLLTGPKVVREVEDFATV